MIIYLAFKKIDGDLDNLCDNPKNSEKNLPSSYIKKATSSQHWFIRVLKKIKEYVYNMYNHKSQKDWKKIQTLPL
jgi:hypothetical protein